MTDTPTSPRIAALREALAAGDRATLERFWAEVDERGTPLGDPAPGAPDKSAPPGPPAPRGAAPSAHVLVTFVRRGGATENVQWICTGSSGKVGQASRARSQTVITKSKRWPTNGASGLGRWPERSTPASAMTRTARGCTASWGSVPPLTTKASPA
jgi:hypothetical protein